jgi:hypothetical protein
MSNVLLRSPQGSLAYWNKWVIFDVNRISEHAEQLKTPAGDPSYRPQYTYELAKEYWELMLRRYSRGDAIEELYQYFEPLLDAWEESERLGQSVYTPEQQITRNSWAVNLDHYIVCFWLVGLALAFDLEDRLWHRLLALVGNEGADELLDRVIATRQAGRAIGATLCHPQPYARLLKAVNAPQADQAQCLQDFVQHWYAALDRPATKGKPAIYNRPYWYTLGDQNFEGGAYFGRWCIEAVAVSKAFGVDDALCLGHEHYPGDLLRPDGPSTHVCKRTDSSVWLRLKKWLASR